MDAPRSFMDILDADDIDAGGPYNVPAIGRAADPMAAAIIDGIGHNQPPAPTPFEAVAEPINDLASEAQHWLDGAGIKSAEEAEMVGKLATRLRTAKKAADEARKGEAKPFDDGKAEVQARYMPLLKRADMAIDAAQKTLSPWLRKVAEEQAAAAAAKRAEAQRLADEAAEAVRKASETNLAEQEAAEALLEDAKRANRIASKAERQTATAGGEAGSRAISLRTYWVTTLVDVEAAIAHFKAIEPEEFAAFVTKLAERHVAGMATEKRAVPGFTVVSEKRAV